MQANQAIKSVAKKLQKKDDALARKNMGVKGDEASKLKNAQKDMKMADD
jgi:hypothetical protein